MIFAIWHRWIERRQWWWLVVLAAVIVLDAFVGTWIVKRELELFRDAW